MHTQSIVYTVLLCGAVSYVATGSKAFSLLAIGCIGVLCAVYMLLSILMAASDSEFETPCQWVAGNYVNIGKNIGKVILAVPLSLIAVSNELLSVKTFNRLSLEWDAHGMSWNVVILSIVTSIMFLSFLYTTKQIMRLMD